MDGHYHNTCGGQHHYYLEIPDEMNASERHEYHQAIPKGRAPASLGMILPGRIEPTMAKYVALGMISPLPPLSSIKCDL